MLTNQAINLKTIPFSISQKLVFISLPDSASNPYLCRPKSVFADSFSTTPDVQWDKSNFKLLNR